jgi:hypothetical protein
MSEGRLHKKNNSASALSQHWPVRPTESVTWFSSARAACGGGVLAARPEWKITPGSGSRAATALDSASGEPHKPRSPPNSACRFSDRPC